MLKVLYATTNKGKLREVVKSLQDQDIDIVGLNIFSNVIPSDFDVKETGKTFAENAVLKATIYGEKANILTVSEDCGLEVDVLNGHPGVYSKRYGDTTLERNKKLLEEMEGISKEKRSARFVSVMAVYNPHNKEVQTFRGTMEGEIGFKMKGQNGFGYDPIFINEFGKTNAEISTDEKNQISHRGRALAEVKEFLKLKIKSLD